MKGTLGFPLQVLCIACITFIAVSWLNGYRPTTQTVANRKLTPVFRSTEYQRAETRSLVTGRHVTPDDIRRDMLALEAQSIILSARRYEKRECSSSSRRYLGGRILAYNKRHNRHPSIELPYKGKITQRILEDALSSLFVDGLLTLKEFPNPAREWLAGFVWEGAESQAEYVWGCQGHAQKG